MGGSELRSMVRGKQSFRWVCALLTLLIASCNAFDRGKLMPPTAGTGGTGGGGDLDGGDDDGGVCVPTTEICNGVDDDCDGMPDTVDEQAQTYCESIVLNIAAGCLPTGVPGETVCARRTTMCNPGWSSCDGSPANGCETRGDVCPCLTCEDAGDSDGGDEDAGF